MSHETGLTRYDAFLGHEPGLWSTVQRIESANDLLGHQCEKEWG